MQQLSYLPQPSPRRLALRELPTSERPRARLERYGPGALSVAELLELIAGSPEALGRELLTRFRGLSGIAQASPAELARVPGLGPARAARIKAALELGRRLILASNGERPQVRSPADAANLLMPEMSLLEQEELRVVLLDTRNHVLDVVTVYRGSAHTALIRAGEVLREAVRRNAAAVIIAHNHPSGDPTPSPEDVLVTRQLVQAGKLLDIEVLDHLIVGKNRFVSLKERGQGF